MHKRNIGQSLIVVLLRSTIVLIGIGRSAAAVVAQQGVALPTLMFDGVTVVDVEQGKLVPDQRVVIEGNRIQAVGGAGAIQPARGTRVVEARGKYLIPGLWDMHTHFQNFPDIIYSLLLAYGVTGMRDMGTGIPLDTLHQWRHEILTGARIGPPRQLFAGPMLDDAPPNKGAVESMESECRKYRFNCFHGILPWLRIDGPEDMRRVVDSLQAAGADFIKVHALGWDNYFALVKEAHRIGIPFAGHIPDLGSNPATLLTVSDSGQRTIEHEYGLYQNGCMGKAASVEQCRPVAERHIRNGTWDVLGPTWLLGHSPRITVRERWQRFLRFLPDSVTRNWKVPPDREPSRPANHRELQVAERAGLPLLIGTDCNGMIISSCDLPGLQLHEDLSLYVDWGLTPLAVLQAVTLNPAKFLGATDSLGTVAPDKLADLVLLDANPLSDIWNTTAIRAVIANGRYFDRAALDQILAELAAQAKRAP